MSTKTTAFYSPVFRRSSGVFICDNNKTVCIEPSLTNTFAGTLPFTFMFTLNGNQRHHHPDNCDNGRSRAPPGGRGDVPPSFTGWRCSGCSPCDDTRRCRAAFAGIEPSLNSPLFPRLSTTHSQRIQAGRFVSVGSVGVCTGTGWELPACTFRSVGRLHCPYAGLTVSSLPTTFVREKLVDRA